MIASKAENDSTSRRGIFAGVAAALTLGAIAFCADVKPAQTRPAATRAAAARAAVTPKAATPPRAPEPPQLSAADNARFEAAIKALSSNAWKERQKAQDTLVSMGENIAPRLSELVKSAGDEEIRTRAGAALRQIGENALLGPSSITLHVKDIKPEELFAQLSRQSHAEFPTWPRNLFQQFNNNSRTITMDFDRADFWTVFKEACQKSGVFPQQIGNDRRMTLTQGGNTQWNGPSVVKGPFLVVANRIYRSNSIDLANPGNVQHEFQMNFTVFAEPKLKVVQSSYMVNVREAVDEKGNSLLNQQRFGEGYSNGQSWMWNLTANLNYPEHAGKIIKVFKGSAKFNVQTKSETLDVPNILSVKNLARTIANRRIVIKECKKNGEQYDVSMTIYRDKLNQQDWMFIQNSAYSIRLLDKDGRALTSQGWGGGGGPDELSYTWNFSRNSWGGDQGKAGEPHRLVWEVPTETRDMNIDFEFKNLPLP